MVDLNFLLGLFLIVIVSYTFMKLSISTVLGYLLCGMILGENGLKVFQSSEPLLVIWSEMGVVFLLFVIGLELSYQRVTIMRKYILLFGLLQFVITVFVLFNIFILFNNIVITCILSAGFAISSTSVVLQVLKENEMQGEQVGKISLGILLFQDIIVVPILVIMPLLKDPNLTSYVLLSSIFVAIIKGIIALIFIFLLSYILRYFIKAVTYSNESVHHELFTLVVLLIILSAVFVSDQLGVQATLGGFIAGLLLSENEFKYHIERSIIAIKGILLGLFFLSVGMKINLQIV